MVELAQVRGTLLSPPNSLLAVNFHMLSIIIKNNSNNLSILIKELPFFCVCMFVILLTVSCEIYCTCKPENLDKSRIRQILVQLKFRFIIYLLFNLLN